MMPHDFSWAALAVFVVGVLAVPAGVLVGALRSRQGREADR